MAYTNNSNLDDNATSIVLNGVYALNKRSVDELKSEFQHNTRTEWRVIYVNTFTEDD